MSSAAPPPFDEPTFDLSGGASCLDFANTVGDRNRAATEKVASYDAWLAFAVQSGLIDRPRAERLAAAATARPRHAERALAEARRLRETIYSIFSSVAAGAAPPAEALVRLNSALPAALSHLCLAPTADGFAWAWSDGDGDLSSPVYRVVRSAADLLASGDPERIRECDSETCTWLFLDGSRNRSRRWCDMASCGNRAKAKRHYRRRRAAAGRRSAPVS